MELDIIGLVWHDTLIDVEEGVAKQGGRKDGGGGRVQHWKNQNAGCHGNIGFCKKKLLVKRDRENK